MKDYYSIAKIEPKAEAAQIQERFEHVCQTKYYQNNVEFQEAFEVLMDPLKRRIHDLERAIHIRNSRTMIFVLWIIYGILGGVYYYFVLPWLKTRFHLPITDDYFGALDLIFIGGILLLPSIYFGSLLATPALNLPPTTEPEKYALTINLYTAGIWFWFPFAFLATFQWNSFGIDNIFLIIVSVLLYVLPWFYRYTDFHKGLYLTSVIAGWAIVFALIALQGTAQVSQNADQFMNLITDTIYPVFGYIVYIIITGFSFFFVNEKYINVS